MSKEENDQQSDIEDEGEDEIDIALKQLKKEEQSQTKYQETRISSEVEKGKSVRIQKKLYD